MSNSPTAGTPLEFWRGGFGDEYTTRNAVTEEQLAARRAMWSRVLSAVGDEMPERLLEIGSNIGLNLRALAALSPAERIALEPNPTARARLLADRVVAPDNALDASATAIPLPDGAVDLAFTCGVLIHVPPEQLLAACREIHRVARRHIVCIEYFSATPEQVNYRGHSGLLFKRDFGDFYLEHFPDLRVLGCGFEWKRTTGLDNLTWWVFRKVD